VYMCVVHCAWLWAVCALGAWACLGRVQLAESEEAAQRARASRAGNRAGPAASPNAGGGASSFLYGEGYEGGGGGRSSRRRAAVTTAELEDPSAVSAAAAAARGGGFGLGGFGDVLRSEWEVQQYMAELEEEDRRQRAREATIAQLPDMLDPWDIASRQFDPGANRLWSTDGACMHLCVQGEGG
jgi:hypothetical protein